MSSTSNSLAVGESVAQRDGYFVGVERSVLTRRRSSQPHPSHLRLVHTVRPVAIVPHKDPCSECKCCIRNAVFSRVHHTQRPLHQEPIII